MSRDHAPVMQTNQAVQRIFKVRRDYNTWVANETLEDYALRFTPRSYRKWSELQVANTAFGAASFLVLEAIGATLLVNYGFINTAWAILIAGIIIFFAGIPVSYYAARYGLDMDLLTRGAGFGYLGSTVTSLIYASFTFIFFALEAAIMAYALELGFGIPPAWGYMICALVVIPLVTHGLSAISRLQTLTLPIWLFLLLLPYLFVMLKEPQVFTGLLNYAGGKNIGENFDFQVFGAAVAVALALITQMAEQVDYLRFMPERTLQNKKRWFAGVLIGGPGWVIPGVVKMLGGALLAYLAISHGIPAIRAVDPNQMYLVAYGYVFSHASWAVAATVVFVVVSQLKINVTNAYAGSLAWSNFFSRITHSHPGRVVWVVFNILIALMLMELNLFQALSRVLGLYSNVAVAWMMTVVADLVINKPLGLSPPGIEFRRAYLYDINPVGIGAMGIASLLSVLAYVGIFGEAAQSFAIFIALGSALVCSPLIAWLTQGRYYIARQSENVESKITHICTICNKDYEGEDISHCPAYQGKICSLCCSLDARCHDLCKPEARLLDQWLGLLEKILPISARRYMEAGLGHFLLLMTGFVIFLGFFIGLLYYQEIQTLTGSETFLQSRLRDVFMHTLAALLLVTGVVAWWVVLANRSRQVAQEESERQTRLLMQEIDSHRHTDELLQKAKQLAEQANQAKSRYITSISHELRTPLNSILGYAQILGDDEAIPPNRRQAVSVIRRSGDHLLSLIESTLDLARIEGGKLSLDVRPLDFSDFMQQIVAMFELQARNKGIEFSYEPRGELPVTVRADERRLRQILINIIGNAVKFTTSGGVVFRLKYQREMAHFEIQDSGPGIAAEELEYIFEPFSRGRAVHVGATGGTGLGLTIAKMLTDLMGGQLTVSSTPGQGSHFLIRLFLPHVAANQKELSVARSRPIGYIGVRQRILIVDNEKNDRELLVSLLEPLGFQLAQAASGQECLDTIPRFLPHLIFIDLAMPGIDGWETIRRIRAGHMTDAEIAIISANAFEKGSDNDVDLDSENFITKPVRVSQLLDWIGLRLGLEWVTEEARPMPPASAPEQLKYPLDVHLHDLEGQIDLGYVRGILNKLGEIERLDSSHFDFVQVMRQLARQFQFETMKQILHKGLNRASHDTP